MEDDRRGWEGMGWDGMGWDGMGWDRWREIKSLLFGLSK